MNRAWLTGLLAGLAAAGLGLTLTGALHAQGAPALTGRVAAVDVGKLFNEYQRMKDITDELKQLEGKLQAENDQRRQAADALQATVDQMDRADPTYTKKLAEVLEAKISHKAWFDTKQAHITREIAFATDRIYRDILKATSQLAQAASYDLVVYADEYPPNVSANPDEIQATMRNRKVLYANPNADVTQQVLDKLNADYRALPHQPQLLVP